jgi:hypothetical protein
MVKCGQAAVIFKMIAACFITAVGGEANPPATNIDLETQPAIRAEKKPSPCHLL